MGGDGLRVESNADPRPGPDAEFWRGRRVLVTGNTGFKGSWLTLVLRGLGADVSGYSLPAPTTPSLFELAKLAELTPTIMGDVRDPSSLEAAVGRVSPEIIVHLAGQALVRRSYEDPIETYGTNVMGTLHLLEAARRAGVAAVVVVTSDKCYENREWARPYREDDALGGADPYSSSKGCAEILVDSYRRSFLAPGGHRTAVATARGGNVIGGGDFSAGRLVPDLVRAARVGEPARIRNPASIRPWQHVLDALTGYLVLAERLYRGGPAFAEAWNFGPAAEDSRAVAEIAELVTALWPDGPGWESDADTSHPAESRLLTLDSSKAHARLGWRPRWTAEEAVTRTVRWYRSWIESGGDGRAAIDALRADFRDFGIPADPITIDERPIPVG